MLLDDSSPPPCRRPTPNVRRVAAKWLVTIACVALAAAVAWWGLRERGPDPPRLADLGAMDPDVAALIGERIDRVSATRSDATAWGHSAARARPTALSGVAANAYETARRSTIKRAVVVSAGADQITLGRTAEAPSRHSTVSWSSTPLMPRHIGGAGCGCSIRANLTGPSLLPWATEVDAADVGGWMGLARVYLTRGRISVRWRRSNVSWRPSRRPLRVQLLGVAYRRIGRDDDARFTLAVGAGGEPMWRDPWSDQVAVPIAEASRRSSRRRRARAGWEYCARRSRCSSG